MSHRSPHTPSTLVEADRVHRDAYLSEAVFEQEQRRFFAATWNFVAHASQVPHPGDYITLDLAGRPLLVVRQSDQSIQVFYNRCAHKGSKLYTNERGNAGRVLQCAYHAWSYRLDGKLMGIPLRQEYAESRLSQCPSGQGLTHVGATQVYRDFVFVRLDERGVDFEDYFGASLQWLDNMADRSPVGKLEVFGGVIRNVIRCNWKMYFENINDTVHPVSTHESAGKAAKAVWGQQSESTPMPISVEQMLPFASGYDFFTQLDAEVYPNGHSALAVKFSTHTGYAYPQDYLDALAQAHGKARAEDVLSRAPQNSVLFPSIAVKGAPLVMRVIRPLSVDRMLIEAWSFRALGAPDLLHERAMTYNRLVFSPMSIVAHDDIHLFESVQQGLKAEGNEWVSLHRGATGEAEAVSGTTPCKGTSEMLMRNQFQAWAKFMAETPEAT
ncbi:MAG: Rieske 2Fe-2S domain-containing protein [Curvibacter lanceolatus]|jgi:phenylpropionate dioxygenase-like ring-hydroxylating dioxygenase large terminal subunit|uniref:aromatic ring-hydroxylating oxygenase subunit alpha n=1 Tax=Curvibacter lanceolatus TaxID=86182 RepID=UPI0003A0D0A0|nr:aromatic ring-hydroxylating dioxygenase subunit alpha [Curvibacter lanceolatus]MBV5295610.1 Rieske 2Fe-2S domain-containing protein [Curvibacter lanceolatus]